MTVREFADKYHVSSRRVQFLIKQGRIPFEVDSGTGYYIISDDAEYPSDYRMNQYRIYGHNPSWRSDKYRE